MHISFAAMKPDPEKRTLTAMDLRKRLLEISVNIREVKAAHALVVQWPESGVKLWTIQIYDNRLVELMEQATACATTLAQMPAIAEGV